MKVNDDTCDCSDGSDEPGTSACDFHFYCEPEHRYIKVVPFSLYWRLLGLKIIILFTDGFIKILPGKKS